MSVYNIVRKCKVLETKMKSEEAINFYPIFLYSTFTVIYFRTSMFSFCESYFRLVGLFDWGYTRRYSFTLGVTEMENLLPTLPKLLLSRL